MPIEIREMVINANITDQAPSQGPQEVNTNRLDRLEELKKEMITETIEKVLTIIQNQKER